MRLDRLRVRVCPMMTIALAPPRKSPVKSPPSKLVHLTREAGKLQSEIGPISLQALIDRGQFALYEDETRISSAYIHIPFCFHKCHYCDFYSIVDSRDRQGVFTERLIEELAAAGEIAAFESMSTIFVGGGTPTLLSVDNWERLLEAIHRYLRPEPGCEFTVEANPETVRPELAEVLVGGEVNRVSIGAQSFDPAQLKTLERWHDPANVGRSVDVLRAAGIGRINLDLIFAIPGQSLEKWLADLDVAIGLEPEHLSCYALMYEPNTPMTVKMQRGRIEPIEQDMEAAMYEGALERLSGAGFEHYEVSAWAKSGYRCQHNLRYWTNANWWPFGPSAAGHVSGMRWKNLPRLGSYLESEGLPPITDFEQLDDDARVGEELMLKLRLIDGIAVDELSERLAVGERGEDRRVAIERHIDAGLLERSTSRLRFTRQGLLLADSVLADLI